MKNIIYLFLLLISCDKNDLKTLDYSLIGKGELPGFEEEIIEESQMELYNYSSWNEVKSQLEPYISDQLNYEIDFEKEMLIAIFDQVRGRTDYSFRIDKIVELSNEVVVFYEQNKTVDGYTVMNQPYIIIKIPKTGKKLNFKKKQIPFNLK